MAKAISSGWGKKLTGRMAEHAKQGRGTLLVGDIQAHMLKEYAKPSTRRQDIIHPSEMAKTGWCPQSTYLRIKAAREADNPYLKASEFVGVQLLNIFDEGHSIHDKWQKRLRDMGDLWGNWLCDICGTVHKNQLYPGVCDYCDSAVGLIYREVPLRAEQYLISGHADGAIPRLNALIEIKSVGVGTARIEAPEVYQANSDGQKIDLQNLWKAIKEPFPSHIRQGQLYLALSNIMELPYTQIIFIYESKFNQGVQEFVVKYDPEYCNEMFAQAAIIKNALEGIMPNGEDCIVCKDKNLDYPFICECVDNPVKCSTGSSCKDCESYGAEKSSPERLGNTSTEVRSNGADSSTETFRRPARTTGGFVRPSR